MYKQGKIEITQSNMIPSKYHKNRILPMKQERIKQTEKVEDQEEMRSNMFKL